MKILCLDIGLKTGFVLVEINKHKHKVIEHGTIKFPSTNDKIQLFQTWLYDIKDRYNLEMVVYEEPILKHYKAVKSHIFFETIIILFCMANSIGYLALKPTEIKKAITGKGNAKKDEVVASVKNIFKDIDLQDDNHSDAFAIYHFLTNNTQIT